MNVFQLVCFVALSNSQTFHAAAEKLYVSQSSFSNSIQALEQELGVELITRGSRGFSLTDAGSSFLVYSNRIVDEYERMNDILIESKTERMNHMIVYTDPMTSFGYNELLAEFRMSAPELNIEIQEMATEHTSDILRKAKYTSEILEKYSDAVCVEFSFGGMSIPGTARRHILRDEMSMLVSESHPLAELGSISLSELRGEKIDIILPRHSDFLYDFALKQFVDAGVLVNVSPHMLWYSSITEAIKTLNYAAVIPNKTAKIFCKNDMRIVNFTDSEPYFIDIVTAENTANRAVLRLIEFVETHVI